MVTEFKTKGIISLLYNRIQYVTDVTPVIMRSRIIVLKEG